MIARRLRSGAATCPYCGDVTGGCHQCSPRHGEEVSGYADLDANPVEGVPVSWHGEKGSETLIIGARRDPGRGSLRTTTVVLLCVLVSSVVALLSTVAWQWLLLGIQRAGGS